MSAGRNGLSLILLLVMLISVVLVGMDCHELTLPNPQCIVCKVKNTFTGPFKKLVSTDASLACRLPQDVPYAFFGAVHRYDLPLPSVRLVISPVTDRAPPVSS